MNLLKAPENETEDEKYARLSELHTQMHRDANVFRQAIGEDAFDKLWVRVHDILRAPMESEIFDFAARESVRALVAKSALDEACFEAFEIIIDREFGEGSNA